MAVRLWDWLLHRVLGKHVADCSHSLGGGRAAVTHPVKHGAFLGVAPQSRNDCQQKAHQFCLPMCVGLIEDVLQVSLDCGH
jgi:hypothetical protein